MNKAFLGFCIFLIGYLLLINNGCNLLKKTSKTSSSDEQTAVAVATATQVDLSKAVRETNEYLYRSDGTFYGHKNIKEQVDQAGYNTVSAVAKANAKKEITVKESVPTKTWIWVGAIVLFGLAIMANWLLGRA